MIAVTVILAAVIGTFVLGFGPDQGITPLATFDTSENGSHVDVELTSEQRLDAWDATCDSPPVVLDRDATVGRSTTVENCTEENVTIIGEYDGTRGVLSG